MRRLAVIGGGAWGTALAVLGQRAGSHPIVWARDPDVVAEINERRQNPAFLPGVALDPAIAATADLDEAITDADAAVLVVPAQFLRAVLDHLHDAIPAGLPVLICTKGIETTTRKTMSELVAEILPSAPVAVLSGPSFAIEVACGLPTAVTIASADPELARAFGDALGNPKFRPYLSTDPVGAEIGGAVKNVIAIACGMILGRGFGDNARAALITRGLAEMIRFGEAKGGRAETFSGLSGIGDLVLTCTARQSRNHALGFALGRGESLGQALAGRRSVVEGVATSAAVVSLAADLGIEMPICEAVAAVLHRGVAIEAMTDRLLRRPYRSE